MKKYLFLCFIILNFLLIINVNALEDGVYIVGSPDCIKADDADADSKILPLRNKLTDEGTVAYKIENGSLKPDGDKVSVGSIGYVYENSKLYAYLDGPEVINDFGGIDINSENDYSFCVVELAYEGEDSNPDVDYPDDDNPEGENPSDSIDYPEDENLAGGTDNYDSNDDEGDDNPNTGLTDIFLYTIPVMIVIGAAIIFSKKSFN